MNSNESDPKIIVDDDWKSQVEKEKEELQKKMEQDTQQSEMPEASIPMLVSTMATQALANLGQIPDPIEGKPVIRKPLAKHFIDTLAVIEEKTTGNLTDEEQEMLQGTLHQLRMVFVNTPDEIPGEEDSSASQLEIPS